jgi:DNA-binding protein
MEAGARKNVLISYKCDIAYFLICFIDINSENTSVVVKATGPTVVSVFVVLLFLRFKTSDSSKALMVTL